MQKYTYIDYLRYQERSLGVREEETQYVIENPKKQKHDKIFKEIFPVVIPIVLYTGREKWKVPITLEERQYESKSQNLQFKYNLVDGGKMSKEELMREESILSRAILLEKLDKPEEILETLKEITTKDLDLDEKYFINLILKYLLSEKLSRDEAKEILENLKGKEDDTMFIDILKKYFDDKEEKAVNEGIKKIVKEMLKNNADEDFIKKVTKITNQELKEIKAEMC